MSSTADLTGRAVSSGTDLNAEVARLAYNPAEEKTLQAIADQMQGPPSAEASRAIQARRVEPKILPLPEPARRWFTRKLTSAFLRDVRDFFYDPTRRDVMMNSVIERIEPGGGPFVVIGHSQGSMIAYAVLQKLARERTDLEVPLFVTIGSPLGIKEVQDELRRITQQARLAVPSCVGRWLNVADFLDPVAFDKWLEDDFRATNGVRVEDDPEWNKDSPRHPHSGTGYLQARPVRRAVRDAVDTGVFQPISKFVIARGVVKELESASSEYRHKVLIELVDPSDTQNFSLDLVRQTVTDEIVRLSGLEAESELLCLESLQRFVAARLTREETEKLAVRLGAPGMPGRTVGRVCRNSPKRALLESPINTVQARPAHAACRAVGSGITWGVLDTGVTASHPHFATHDTIKAQFGPVWPQY